ncbi:MAG: IPT/TIG domain-containing protein, partial [Planctomycetota bacterium]
MRYRGKTGVLLVVAVLALSTACHDVNEVPWTPHLVLTGVTPANGPVQGGTTVVLHGVGFKTGLTVRIGLSTVSAPTVLNSTRITFQIPEAALPGPVDVTVTNPGGEASSLPNAYLYTTWWSDPAHPRNLTDPPYTLLPRRLPITVSVPGATPAQTDYQVRVEIPFDNEMESDFSDLRFSVLDTTTSPESEAAVSFWLETYTPFDRAVFWVEIPAVPAGPGALALYAYYGDAAALAAAPLNASLPPSDFDATFTKAFGETGLVARWACDAGAGTAVSDATSNGNDGTFLPGAGTWLGSEGGGWGGLGGIGFLPNSGDALLFGASDPLTYVDCGNDATLDLVSELTLEGWVRGDAGSTSGVERVVAAKWGQKADFTSGWENVLPGVGRSGFAGAAFDGRYVYFIPKEDGSGSHAEVLRYDTRAPFSASAAWESFDASTVTGGGGLGGFTGAAFDGTHLYFANASNDGRVLQYDTTQSFTSGSAWTVYDPSNHGVGTFPKGYFGGVFDGRYVYFSPERNVFGPHGEILRYDTITPFTAAASWSAVNPAQLGVNTHANSNPTGFQGGIFDGR